MGEAAIAFVMPLLHQIPDFDPESGITVWLPHVTWVGISQDGEVFVISGSALDLFHIEMEFLGWKGIAEWIKCYHRNKRPSHVIAAEHLFPFPHAYMIVQRESWSPLPSIYREGEIARRMALAWIAYEAGRWGVPARIENGILYLPRDALPFRVRPLSLPRFSFESAMSPTYHKHHVKIPWGFAPEREYSSFSISMEQGENWIAVDIDRRLRGFLRDEGWGGRLFAVGNEEVYEEIPPPDRSRTYDIVAVLSFYIGISRTSDLQYRLALCRDGEAVFVENDARFALPSSIGPQQILMDLLLRREIRVGRQKISRGPSWSEKIGKIIQNNDPLEQLGDLLDTENEITRRLYLAEFANHVLLCGEEFEICDFGLRTQAIPTTEIGEVMAQAYLPNEECPGWLPMIRHAWAPRDARPPRPWAVRYGPWAAAMVDETHAIIPASAYDIAKVAGMIMQSKANQG